MKIRLLPVLVSALVLTASAFAQDANSGSPSGQAPAQGSAGREGQGQRGGRGGWGAGMGAGRGITGTVTEVAADHYTVKTGSGDRYTVRFSANTRILKQTVGGRERGEGGQGERSGQGRPGMGTGAGAGGNAQQTLKPADIKVGDAVAALGEVDSTAKSVGAVTILQIDPERAKQMREMQANYGKTWLQGKVTAIDGVKVTLLGSVDNVAHAFTADENTTFRKRRDPITLADIQSGDEIRVEGAVKDGSFLATSVSVMGMPQGSTPTVPRSGHPNAQPVP
jgi:hypothetical protein